PWPIYHSANRLNGKRDSRRRFLQLPGILHAEMTPIDSWQFRVCARGLPRGESPTTARGSRRLSRALELASTFRFNDCLFLLYASLQSFSRVACRNGLMSCLFCWPGGLNSSNTSSYRVAYSICLSSSESQISPQ